MRLFSVFLAVMAMMIPAVVGMSCSANVGGTEYDLSSLSGQDYKITPDTGNYAYFVNVCGAVTAPNCANNAGGKGGGFACQVRKSPVDQFESVLAYSTVAPEPIWGPSVGENGGVKLMFTNGDLCNLRQRVLNIDFQCDESGRAMTADESPQCTFNIVFPTAKVCPGGGSSKSSSLSGGWIFIIILIVCLFVYILAGCLYKRQRQGTSGVESCPNIDFWRELPRLCRDGCTFTWGKLRGLCGGGGGSGASEPYETIK